MQPIETEATTSQEPAPKMSPTDPRLAIRHPVGRTLRKGPALAVAVSLLCIVLASLVFAMVPSSQELRAEKARAEEQKELRKPIIPDSILHASDQPARREATTRVAERPQSATAHPDSRYSEANLRQKQTEELWKARSASVLYDVGAGPLSTPTDDGATLPLPSTEAHSAPATSASEISDADPNLQERKNAFLNSEGLRSGDGYLSARVERPRSPYEVKAGSIIPAVLITGINSDLPGPVVGQVRENVYDSVSGRFLLIPQGSRLLASYDSMVAWGQERVLMCWNRLIFPNGNSLHLECMPGADLTGAAGLTDRVDEHWFRIVKGAAVASLLAATAQGVAGDTRGYNPTVPQLWARNAAGEINSVGQVITRRNINIQPTITIRPGFSVNVMVTKDMIIPPYTDKSVPSGG
jgi:type IV secretory pathway VirB10-like protein